MVNPTSTHTTHNALARRENPKREAGEGHRSSSRVVVVPVGHEKGVTYGTKMSDDEHRKCGGRRRGDENKVSLILVFSMICENEISHDDPRDLGAEKPKIATARSETTTQLPEPPCWWCDPHHSSFPLGKKLLEKKWIDPKDCS